MILLVTIGSEGKYGADEIQDGIHDSKNLSIKSKENQINLSMKLIHKISLPKQLSTVCEIHNARNVLLSRKVK